jgi:hypothetical protein
MHWSKLKELAWSGGHPYNPSTREAKARGFQIKSHHGLHSQFEVWLGYTVRPCQKKIKQNKNSNKTSGLQKISSRK